MDLSHIVDGLVLTGVCAQIALSFRIWSRLARIEERLRAHQEQLQRHERWIERRERARPL